MIEVYIGQTQASEAKTTRRREWVISKFFECFFPEEQQFTLVFICLLLIFMASMSPKFYQFSIYIYHYCPEHESIHKDQLHRDEGGWEGERWPTHLWIPHLMLKMAHRQHATSD